MGGKLDPAVAGEINRMKKTIEGNDKKIKKLHDDFQKSTEQKTKLLQKQVEEIKLLGDEVFRLMGDHDSIMKRQEQQIAELGGK